MTRRELIDRVEGALPHHVDYLTRNRRFRPAPERDASLRRHYSEAHVRQLREHVESVEAKRARLDARRDQRQEAKAG